jgi:FecR protein
MTTVATVRLLRSATKAALLWALLPTVLAAQQPMVTPVSGVVEIRMAPGAGFSAVTESGAYPSDAVLRTGANGFALINYADSTEIVVRPGTQVELGGQSQQGVRVFLGKVLIRVRRLFTAGQERSHRTPTTVAAVRGTEFGLAVEGDGSTQVFVFEGRVAVSNSELRGPPVQVAAGNVTEVAPRRPPTDPHSFQAGEFERGSTGEIERGEDRAVEAGQAPTTARYLAFADHDLDALANPAYLAVGPQRGGSGVLLGSLSAGSQRVTTNGVKTFDEEGGERRALAQAMAWATVGKGFRLGGVVQGDVGSEQAVRAIRFPRSPEVERLQQDSNWRIAEGRLLASLQRGATAFGVAAGHRQGSQDADVSPAGSLAPPMMTDGSSNISTLSAGVRLSGRRTLGLSYHRAWVDARQDTNSNVLDTDGTRDAIEALIRSWGERAGWGGWVRVERTATAEERRIDGALIYHEDLKVWTARAGFGLGFMPTPDLLFSLDLAGGVASETAFQINDTGARIEDEDDTRLSGSIHAGVQLTLAGPWRAEVTVLHSGERIDRRFSLAPIGSAPSTATDVRSLFGTRGGVAFLYRGDRMTVRYGVMSPGEGDLPWVHTFLVALAPR